MDGNYDDIHGSNNGFGVLMEPFVSGKIGDAASFDGDDSYIRVLDDPTLQLTSGFTLSSWIYADGLNGGFEGIFTKGDTATAQGNPDASAYSIFIRVNRVYFGVTKPDFTFGYALSTPDSILTGNWYHIVCTWNGTNGLDNQKIYINGNLNATSSLDIYEMVTNSTHVRIGNDSRNDSRGRFQWDGKIDQTVIWNVPININQVKELYNDGNGLPFSSWV